MLTTAPSHPVPPPHHHHVQHIPAHQQLAHHHSQAMQQHHQQSQSQTASQVQTHQQQAPAPPPPPQQPPQQQAAPSAHAYHPPASSGVLQPPQLTGQPAANLWVNHAAASQMYAAAFAAMSASSAAAAAEAAVSNPAPAAPRPTFVNAKQYRRILKRREARAKLDEYYQKRKAYLKEQKEKKPYMHESRHRHAMKRPRGPGGRFLTKAELEVYYAEHPDQDPNRINSSSETGSDQGSVQEPKKMKVEVQG